MYFAAEILGFRNFIPPYARARGPEILRGVNYASGAAGIRDETGNNLVLVHLETIVKIINPILLIFFFSFIFLK